FCFFFQAEDGIRDLIVTGVQTCALPIYMISPDCVILITIDTVRADHVGCYGATGVQTPTLDALARDGIVFERAISQVPLTWPSRSEERRVGKECSFRCAAPAYTDKATDT